MTLSGRRGTYYGTKLVSDLITMTSSTNCAANSSVALPRLPGHSPRLAPLPQKQSAVPERQMPIGWGAHIQQGLIPVSTAGQEVLGRLPRLGRIRVVDHDQTAVREEPLRQEQIAQLVLVAVIGVVHVEPDRTPVYAIEILLIAHGVELLALASQPVVSLHEGPAWRGDPLRIVYAHAALIPVAHHAREQRESVQHADVHERFMVAEAGDDLVDDQRYGQRRLLADRENAADPLLQILLLGRNLGVHELERATDCIQPAQQGEQQPRHGCVWTHEPEGDLRDEVSPIERVRAHRLICHAARGRAGRPRQVGPCPPSPWRVVFSVRCSTN